MVVLHCLCNRLFFLLSLDLKFSFESRLNRFFFFRFKEFVFEVVVDKKYCSQEVLDVYAKDPVVLPAWDPMGSLARSSSSWFGIQHQTQQQNFFVACVEAIYQEFCWVWIWKTKFKSLKCFFIILNLRWEHLMKVKLKNCHNAEKVAWY